MSVEVITGIGPHCHKKKEGSSFFTLIADT